MVMSFLSSHLVLILTLALTLSEMLALVFPNASGILKALIVGLRAIGAKDVDGQ